MLYNTQTNKERGKRNTMNGRKKKEDCSVLILPIKCKESKNKWYVNV